MCGVVCSQFANASRRASSAQHAPTPSDRELPHVSEAHIIASWIAAGGPRRKRDRSSMEVAMFGGYDPRDDDSRDRDDGIREPEERMEVSTRATCSRAKPISAKASIV